MSSCARSKMEAIPRRTSSSTAANGRRWNISAGRCPCPRTNRLSMVHSVAAELMGMRYVYLQAGAAPEPDTRGAYRFTRKATELTIITGGGIRRPESATVRVAGGRLRSSSPVRSGEKVKDPRAPQRNSPQPPFTSGDKFRVWYKVNSQFSGLFMLLPADPPAFYISLPFFLCGTGLCPRFCAGWNIFLCFFLCIFQRKDFSELFMDAKIIIPYVLRFFGIAFVLVTSLDALFCSACSPGSKGCPSIPFLRRRHDLPRGRRAVILFSHKTH